GGVGGRYDKRSGRASSAERHDVAAVHTADNALHAIVLVAHRYAKPQGARHGGQALTEHCRVFY
nr:hypothetical protein [Tanacetum cinerariifolium]